MNPFEANNLMKYRLWSGLRPLKIGHSMDNCSVLNFFFYLRYSVRLSAVAYIFISWIRLSKAETGLHLNIDLAVIFFA